VIKNLTETGATIDNSIIKHKPRQ